MRIDTKKIKIEKCKKIDIDPSHGRNLLSDARTQHNTEPYSTYAPERSLTFETDCCLQLTDEISVTLSGGKYYTENK